jgi:hypothetical protein
MPETMLKNAQAVRELAERASYEHVKAELNAIAMMWERMAVWARNMAQAVKDRGETKH